MRDSRLTIGEFASRAGVSASTLRFYERQGLIWSSRTSGNQRRYDRGDLRRIAFIRAAQKIGLSIIDIKAAFAQLPHDRPPNTAEWKELSSRWQERITAKVEALNQLQSQLDDCMNCGCLSTKHCSLTQPQAEPENLVSSDEVLWCIPELEDGHLS